MMSQAYISPSAQIMNGCIIEPMAVVHTGCVIAVGCIISAGAVVNYNSMCCEGGHIDCNATVEGYCLVPAGTDVCSGVVYKKKDTVRTEDLFFDLQMIVEKSNDISKRNLKRMESSEYNFEIGM